MSPMFSLRWKPCTIVGSEPLNGPLDRMCGCLESWMDFFLFLFLHRCHLTTILKLLLSILGTCILRHDSFHGSVLRLKDCSRKKKGKRAENEQVPLPATSLIALVLAQTPNQTNISAAGIQMRWWNAPVHSNVQIGTISDFGRVSQSESLHFL